MHRLGRVATDSQKKTGRASVAEAQPLCLNLVGLDERLSSRELEEAQAFGLALLAEVRRWRASNRSQDVFAKIAREVRSHAPA